MTRQDTPTGADADDPRIAFFDRQAPTWDDEGLDANAARQRMRELADEVGIRPGASVLEAGFGTGLLTEWLVAAAGPGRVTAVDFSPQMLACAAAKGIDADFRQADLCRDDLGSACYDLALCFHSFPHFRDQPGALRSLAKSLKPGGKLAVVHLRGSDHINGFHASVGGEVAGDLLPVGEQWTPLLKQAGLECVTLRDEDEGFLLVAVVTPAS